MQTIDMNQDAQLSEGLKVRNLIRTFEDSDDTVIVGFPEQMITEQNGSVAQFSALSEQVFGTMVQRYMGEAAVRKVPLRSPGRLGFGVGPIEWWCLESY